MFFRSVDISPALDITKKIKIVKNSRGYALKYLNHVLVDGIPEEVLRLKYNGRSPLEWSVRRSKPRKYSTSGNSDEIKMMFEEDGLNANEAYLSHLKKIITVSIETIDLVKLLNQFKLNFKDETFH